MKTHAHGCCSPVPLCHANPGRLRPQWQRTAIIALVLTLMASLFPWGPMPHAKPLREIKFSHGSGLCNMPLFYAGEKQLFRKYGIEGIVVLTPMAGDSAIQLSTGQ